MLHSAERCQPGIVYALARSALIRSDADRLDIHPGRRHRRGGAPRADPRALPDPAESDRRRGPRDPRGSAATFRSTLSRPRPGPRCSTGSCRASGTSATHGSRRRTARGSRRFRTRRSICSATASRSTSTLTRDELLEHVFTDPAHPDRVPYRTSYWAERWGFCMSQREADSLPEGDYRGVSTRRSRTGHSRTARSGSTGASSTTRSAHDDGLPSRARERQPLGHRRPRPRSRGRCRPRQLRHSYRLVWSPGTIGPLCWLHHNRGLVGDDRARPRDLVRRRPRAAHVQAEPTRGDARPTAPRKSSSATRPAPRSSTGRPYGGDERQFCSPGFDLPFGAFSRSPADAFPEYHSSDDDLSVVTPEALADSYRTLLRSSTSSSATAIYVNASPFGEPQLGRRGPLPSIGGGSSREAASLWLLSLARRQQRASSTSRSAPACRSRSSPMRPTPRRARPARRSGRRRPVVRPRPVAVADRPLGAAGHAMPKQGSSQRTPDAASGHTER